MRRRNSTLSPASCCQLLLAFAWSLRGRLKGCALDRTTRRTEKELSSKPRFEHRQLESLTSCPAPRICSRKAFLNRFNSLFSDVCQAISLAVLLSDVELCPRQACCFTRRPRNYVASCFIHRTSATDEVQTESIDLICRMASAHSPSRRRQNRLKPTMDLSFCFATHHLLAPFSR